MRKSQMQKLLEALKLLDEVTLLEMLDIRSHELVEAFTDKIVEKEEWLYGEVFSEEDSEE